MKKVEPNPVSSKNAPVYNHNSVVVLMYHNINSGLGRGSISPEKLDQQLAMLQQKGFHIIPIDHLTTFLDGKGKVPDNALALTFNNC